MGEQDKDMLHQVQQYRKLVLLYEALDKEIDQLIMKHGGASQKMPSEALARYRELAHKRDNVQNEMRQLEQLLDIGDT